MPSLATCRNADLDTDIAAQKAAIAEIEEQLWAGGLKPAHLESYQAAFRRLEDLIAARGKDRRHKFVVVVPVADRPQHLKSCLDSLLELCHAFGYGGREEGRYRKIAVLIADDSADPASVAGNLELARQFSARGLDTVCLSPDEQMALLDALGASKATLRRVLGNPKPEAFGHKGQAVMRNIAALKLNQLHEHDEPLLFYSIDSDQEFQVKVATPQGERNIYAVNFFYRLDEIFAATDALLLTGKVVGDPPVSPAVMTNNFLQDVIGFLGQMAEAPGPGDGSGPCRNHWPESHTQGEAAYHDMADLFGFKRAEDAYRYHCPLRGPHSDADCFAHFAARLNGFFYGEHPTRVSYYVHDGVLASVQPARTVYAGNYVFRPEGLKYFIPFASLRLRMSGPTLGRLIKSEIGGRFVSANLPMLHKRTVEGTSRSEFRPGIDGDAGSIDLSGEFERQFYGDVMLFSVERLTSLGFPGRPLTEDVIAATMDPVREEMLDRYNARQEAILNKLAQLEALLHEPARWWNTSDRHATAVANFVAFVGNVARNFGKAASGYRRINSAEIWAKWRGDLIDAVQRYPEDRRAWEAALAAARH